MPRRVTLPGAAELFRPTQPYPRGTGDLPDDLSPDAPPDVPGRGSGRIRHNEKITVYVSTDELVALEEARLALRTQHAMAVDRGRIVREAIAAVLADLEARGAESDLVRRLSSR